METRKASKLIPAEVLGQIPDLYETDEEPIYKTMAWARIIAPAGAYTAYVLEYGPESGLLFTLTSLDGRVWELGYTSLEELEQARVGCMPMEADDRFEPTPLGEIEELGDWAMDF